MIPDFRRLWSGMAVSLFGDGVFLVALAWQVYTLTNTPAALATVGLAMTIPHVAFLVVGGAISDRADRRRIMLIADVIRGVAVGVLGWLSLAGSLELWHVYLLAAVYGAGTAFFGPAFDAIVPELVPEKDLQRANSLDQLVRPAALFMIGPAVGGWAIAAIDVGGAFLLDAITFVVSIAAISRMTPRPNAQTGGLAISLADVREGFGYVRAHVWLWGTFVAATIAYLLFWGPVEVLLPYIVRNEMGGTAKDLGYVFAVGGLGAILVAIVMARRNQPKRHITFMYVAWTASTLAIAGYGLARYPWQAMIAAFAFNALEAAGTIVWTTTKQRFVPNRLLGRVSSLDWFISIGLLPVSFALTAPAAAAFGTRATLIAAGVIGGIATLGFLFLPGMRATEHAGDENTHASPEASAALQPSMS